MVTLGGATSRWRPQHSGMRWILRKLIRLLLFVLTRIQIEGEENIPESGPLIVAANHFHFLDPLAIIYAMPWPLDFIGGFHMAFAPKCLRWIPRLWGLHRVRRSGSSRGALRQAEETLKAGGFLGIFPEGGSWAAVLRPPRPGSAFLATRTEAQILPVGLCGVQDIFVRLKRLRRATVRVQIGKPIGPFAKAEGGRAGRSNLDAVGDAILRAVAMLLPPEERGVYSEDPKRREEALAVARYPWENGRFMHPSKHTSESSESVRGE